MGDKRGAVPTYVSESIRRNLIATAQLLASAQHCEIGEIADECSFWVYPREIGLGEDLLRGKRLRFSISVEDDRP